MFTIKRYEELDSLRGIAALTVLCSHIYLSFHETFISKLLFEFGILRFAIAGSEAVILFFILSGFVLSLPYYSGRTLSYGSYVVRRICRIYLPYIFAMGTAVLLRELFYSGRVDGLTNEFNSNWVGEINSFVVKSHLIFVGVFESNVNNVVWSLVHEMRISLLFPLIMLLLLRIRWKMAIAIAGLFSAVSVIYSTITDAPFVGTEYYASIHYMAMFILGAALAKYRELLAGKLKALSPYKILGLLGLGIFIYLYVHPSFILTMMFSDMKPFYRTVIDSWFISLGALLIIACSFSSTSISAFLTNRLIGYLGKISYSLYLLHMPILLAMVHGLHNTIPMWLICLIAVAVTLIASSIMYRFVELPSMKLGKMLTSRVPKDKGKAMNKAA